ncbi:hypothetical protein E2C01_068077 [Portunus trituberculatus]|uniref:Uncharacterized protein n=1 Tax=Portunus trituberculatus TaxID=210409 RepID=A0A5B7HMY2_PORTR|nr:hypothetical protein [Portunus trituberculatus]
MTARLPCCPTTKEEEEEEEEEGEGGRIVSLSSYASPRLSLTLPIPPQNSSSVPPSPSLHLLPTRPTNAYSRTSAPRLSHSSHDIPVGKCPERHLAPAEVTGRRQGVVGEGRHGAGNTEGLKVGRKNVKRSNGNLERLNLLFTL